MKIKRFVDKDMRQVLKRVREEQGPDAVILSNRRIDEGIEVIAAIDYDAALMQHAIKTSPRERQGAETAAQPAAQADAGPAGAAAAPQPDAATPAPAVELARVLADDPDVFVETATLLASPGAPAGDAGELTDIRPPFAPPAASGDEALLAMREEITSLRGLLETQLSGLLWKNNARRSPLRAQVLRNLARLGVAADVAGLVVNQLEPMDELKHMWQQPLAALARLIPTAGDELLTKGGRAALIGPTGVGKTTTIAKLAARFAMEHGTDDIALVCADAFRIGAREHLTAFANIIGVPMHAASDPAELTEILGRLRNKKLVLIDTEGVSQRDADLTDRLSSWGRNEQSVRFYLTLSACNQEGVLDETVRSFGKLPLAGAIVTKIDEAAQLGCMLSVAIRHKLPLAWLTDGQRIPDDLHAAKRKKLWLINRAVDCMEASQSRVDERMMAENYGTVSTVHA